MSNDRKDEAIRRWRRAMDRSTYAVESATKGLLVVNFLIAVLIVGMVGVILGRTVGRTQGYAMGFDAGYVEGYLDAEVDMAEKGCGQEVEHE